MNRDIDNIEPEGPHIQALLSAYIDNDLTLAAHEQVRRHIETCADCRGNYIELRATQQLLQSLPTVPPPRAFTLTAEDVAQRVGARAGFFQRLLSPRNTPRFAMGSGLAFMVLVFMLMGNLLTTDRLATSAYSPASGSFESSQNVAPSEAQPAQESTTEPAQDMKSVGGVPAPYPTTPAAAQPAADGAPPEATPQADIGRTSGAAAAPTQVAPEAPLGDAGSVWAGTTTSPTTANLEFGVSGRQAFTGTQDQSYLQFYTQGNDQHLAGPASIQSASQSANTAAPISGMLLFQASLAALGVILAVGAIVSRRRRV